MQVLKKRLGRCESALFRVAVAVVSANEFN